MKTNRIAGLTGFLLVLAPSLASANGFYIQEMSAAGTGQAGALAAAGGRPATQFQNAANLSFSRGLQLEFTGTTYFISGTYENPQGQKTKNATPPIFVPYFFASYKVNDWLAVGIGEFTAFGLKSVWPSDWEGRTIAIESGLETFTINPNLSFGPIHGFAIAVGFNAVHGSFRVLQGLNLGQPAPGDTAANTVDLRGAAWGYGVNMGVSYQPAPWVRLGLAWRSGVRISTSNGTVDFDVGKAFQGQFPDQHFRGKLDLPNLVMGGVRFWPRKDLSLELDAQWVQWSSYDRLDFQLSEGIIVGPGQRQMSLTTEKRWKDTVQLRLGMEWVGLDEHLAVRAGFLWDQNPVPDSTVDPSLPDNHRLMPCISLGTKWSGFYLDLAYMPVFNLPRKAKVSDGAPMGGTFRNTTHDIIFTLGYHWDPQARSR
ncbi:MAG TPA: outer membrane protein transport protein [Myxococcota bacterium]|nr:outer membrane protein transport protein [Myxococcota bacterium]HQK51403.1 outer membrane protein transport protein [Myxococcota bacterium]